MQVASTRAARPRVSLTRRQEAQHRTLWSDAVQRAQAEISFEAVYLRTSRYIAGTTPQPGTWTAANLWQSQMIETRDLEETNALTGLSPLGPLHFAVDRLRSRFLGYGRGARMPLLVIGAGQRIAEAGLRTMLGNRIQITECSPRYAPNNETDDGIRIVDREILPAAGIDTAVLPNAAFMLAYSVYGSYYGHDQPRILQKIVDSLLPGGELFLQWPLSRGWLRSWCLPRFYANRELARLIRTAPAVFRAFGLDLTVQTLHQPRSIWFDAVVWGRKLTAEVNVADAMAHARIVAQQMKRAQAATADGIPVVAPMFWTRRGSSVVDTAPQLRLSRDGPWLARDRVATADLRAAVAALLDRLMRHLGVSSYAALWPVLVPEMGAHACGLAEADAQQQIVTWCLRPERADDLMTGTPLTTLLIDDLVPAAAQLTRAFPSPVPERHPPDHTGELHAMHLPHRS